jgi:hypothetical protein
MLRSIRTRKRVRCTQKRKPLLDHGALPLQE